MATTCKSVTHLERELGDELMARLFDPANTGKVRECAKNGFQSSRFITLTPITPTPVFVDPLNDVILNDRLRELAEKWRKMAVDHFRYNHPDRPVLWLLRAGCTLKQHVPKLGPCYGKKKPLDYLQSWNFDDTPTESRVVPWIPRVVPNSNYKSVGEQLSLLVDLRNEFDLPESHLSSFGSVQSNAALILRHFQLTGERVPLDKQWIRTDSLLDASGYRFGLGDFDDDGLDCGSWGWDGGRRGGHWCFARGVETLGD